MAAAASTTAAASTAAEPRLSPRIIMAESIAAATAAGRGPRMAGAPAARSRPARRLGFSRPARPSPMPASRRRRACAGITPIPATARDSGTPASKTPASGLKGPTARRTGRGLLSLGLAARSRRSRIHRARRSRFIRRGTPRRRGDPPKLIHGGAIAGRGHRSRKRRSRRPGFRDRSRRTFHRESVSLAARRPPRDAR